MATSRSTSSAFCHTSRHPHPLPLAFPLPMPVSIMPSLSLPSALLPLFLSFLLLLSSLPSISSSTSPINVAGATGHWLTAMANVTAGPCFNSSTAVFTYPSPLYPTAPPLILDSAAWDSHYMHTWIFKIFAEELLGYRVLINDRYTDPTPTSLQRIDAGQVTANVEWWPSSDAAYLQYVTTARTVRDQGSLGVLGQLGLFMTRWTVKQYTSLLTVLEYYRMFKINPSFTVPAFNASWQYLVNPVTGQDMRTRGGVFICPDNATAAAQNITLPFPYGCSNGMFIPPLCQVANMTQSCLVVFHNDPQFDGGSVPQLILSQKLPFVVAFIDQYQQYLAYLAQVAHAPLIFFIQSPDPFLDLNCTNPLTTSNTTSLCFQRMLFSSSDPSCDGQTAGATRTCDWPQLPLTKVASASTMRSLTRVNTLLASMSLATLDDKGMFTQLELLYPVTGPKDYKAVACQWIQTHSNVWGPWIAPPFVCASTDMAYTVGACDDQTNRLPITWTYTYPKACQGGLTLPQGESVPCDVVPTTSRLYLVVCGVTAVTVVLLLAVAALHAYCMIRMERPVLMVQQVAGWWLSLLAFGVLCLTLVPIVSVSGLSESVCRGRVFLAVFGFSLCLQALHQHSEKLYKAMSALLATSNPRKDVLRVALVLALNLLIMLTGTLVSSSELMLSMYTEYTPAGATVSQLYCTQPPLWCVVVLLLLNGLFAVRCVERCVRSVLKMRNSTRLYSKRPMAKLGHTLQIHTVVWTCCLFVLAAILLLYYTFDANMNENNTGTVTAFAAVLFCLVLLSLFTLIAPSVHLHVKVLQHRAAKLRQKLAEAENSKNSHSKSESERGMELATLAGTLSDPFALLLFQQYAESSLEGENIAFLLAMQSYVGVLKKDATTVQEVLDGAKELYVHFIADQSEQQINISAKQKGELEGDMKRLLDKPIKAAPLPVNPNQALIKAAMQRAANGHLPGQIADEGAVDSSDSISPLPTSAPSPFSSDEGTKGGASVLGLSEGSYNFDFLKSPTTASAKDSVTRSLTGENGSARSVSGVGLSVTSKGNAGSRLSLSPASGWTGGSGLATTLASKELRNKAKAVFDPSVKEIFNLLTVNAWPRFLQSKQAQRANELLGWASAFEGYSDVEQVGLINKLRKMRAMSSQKRASLTGGGDGLREHTTNISTGGVSGLSTYAHDKDESVLDGVRDSHPVNALMSPSSHHPPPAGPSSRRNSTVAGRGASTYVPLGLAAADDPSDTASPQLSSPTPMHHSVGSIGSVTDKSHEAMGGALSVTMAASRSPALGRSSMTGGGGGPSQRNNTGVMSTAPSIAINAIMNHDAVDDVALDSDRAEHST